MVAVTAERWGGWLEALQSIRDKAPDERAAAEILVLIQHAEFDLLARKKAEDATAEAAFDEYSKWAI